MTQNKVHADLSGLEKLLKDIGGDYAVKVGIIGQPASEVHEETDLTNAELGLIHEFGSITNNIPPRSFLRMPLESRQVDLMDVLDSSVAKGAINRGEFQTLYGLLGVKAVEIIQYAFSSGGFGQWEPNKPQTVKRKGSSAPLIDTSQLRRSISWQIVKSREVQ